MNKDDRVVWKDDPGSRGTITRVSPAGYFHIEWDKDGPSFEYGTHFSPHSAQLFHVVTGDDALPRHRWIGITGPCTVCKTELTDETFLEPCRGLKR